MAISFKNIKDPKLQLTDKLTFGKFAQCRICDIIEDQYEYLIWAGKAGLVVYAPEVVLKLLDLAGFHETQRHYEEEIKPWMRDDYDESEYDISMGDLPDVPF
jgi:hypothetical protein